MLEYIIVGGRLRVHRNVFIQELLSKDSLFRSLLNWKTTRDFSVKHPLVSEADENNLITINFSSEAGVSIGESPKELLAALKAKYREKIKGKIVCRVEYSMYGGIFIFYVDLDSDDGEINYSTR